MRHNLYRRLGVLSGKDMVGGGCQIHKITREVKTI